MMCLSLTAQAQTEDSSNLGRISLTPSLYLIHRVLRGESFALYYYQVCMGTEWLSVQQIWPQVWRVTNNSQTDQNVVCQ
jgi:hypothetical protein